MVGEEEVTMMKGKRSKRARLTSASALALTIATSSAGDGVITDEEDMANCLILLAKGQGQRFSHGAAVAVAVAVGVGFQCKTCSKSFPSFQALGGHRASHRKPNKPTNQEEERRESFVDDGTNLSLQICSRNKTHECSICGAEFGSGQALGGHMRRHRPIGVHGVKRPRPRNLLSLDLNLPAPQDDHMESNFHCAEKEQIIVFSASPLIDCHY